MTIANGILDASALRDLGADTQPLRCVGTRAGISGASQSNGTNLQFNTRSVHYVPIAASQIRLLYSGFYASQGAAEADQVPDLTVKVGLRPAGASPGKTQPDAPSLSTPRRVTFGRAQSGLVTGSTTSVSGSSDLISDAAPFYLPGNTILVVSTYATLPSGQWWRTRSVVSGPGERNEEGVTVTDRSISGDASGTGAWSVGPNLILGVPADPASRAVAIIGDSIADGTTDSADATTGVMGYIERGLGIGVPNAKFTRSGVRLSHWASRGYSQVDVIGRYFTDVIIQLGINDIANSTLEVMQTNLSALVAKFTGMGLRVYATTLTPWATSTDSFATLANQTVTAHESKRVDYNDWLRTLPVGLEGVLESADVAESSRNSGKWKITGASNYATTDGIHPSVAMHALMAAAIPPATFGY